MDSVVDLAEFVYSDRNEAFDMLENKEADIVIDLPQDFYKNVDEGINKPLSIYIRDDSDEVTQAFVKILRCGSEYVKITEATVYAFIDVQREGGYKVILDDESVGNHIAASYIELLLHRGRLFSNKIISGYGEVAPGQFYFTTIYLFMLSIYGMGMGHLYNKSELSVEKCMVSWGISKAKISVCKQCVIALQIFIMGILIYGISIIADYRFEVFGIKFDYYHLPVIALVSVCLAIMYNAFFGMVDYGYEAFVGLLLINILMLFSCGMILPDAFLPDIISKIGIFMPFKYMYSLLLSFHDGTTVGGNIVSLLAFMAIFECMGVVCKKY